MIDFGLLHAIALATALSWASGINVYAVLMMLGFGSMTGMIDLPNSLDFTTYPLVIGLAVIFFVIEFIVDKIPFVDSAWDGPHTFIRIILGGFLASQVIGEIDPTLIVVGAFVGSFIASSSHALKAGTRVVANTSPEPFSNIGLSLVEDFLVIGAILLAIKFPLFFLILFAAYVLLAIWLLPKIWHGVKKIFSFLGNFFNQPQAKDDFNVKKETQGSEDENTTIDNISTKGTLLEKPNTPPQLPNN